MKRKRRKSGKSPTINKITIKFELDFIICKCAYCGKGLTPNSFTWDHVFPKSRFEYKGGLLEAPCCRSCNESKEAMTLEEWKAALKDLLKKIHKNDVGGKRRINIKIRRITKLIKSIKPTT